MKKVSIIVVSLLALVLLASCMSTRFPAEDVGGVTTRLAEKDYVILGPVSYMLRP